MEATARVAVVTAVLAAHDFFDGNRYVVRVYGEREVTPPIVRFELVHN